MATLELKSVRKELPFQVQTLSMGYLSRLAKHRDNVKIDFDVWLPTKNKNLQRPFCWTIEQKSELILSVLKGIKIPAIAIIIDDFSFKPGENGKIYRIIDGKQRLSTLLDFYLGKFAFIYEDKEYYFNDLDEAAQCAISGFTVLAEVAYEYTNTNEAIADEDKIAWFERINFAGTPQDIEHLNNLKS